MLSDTKMLFSSSSDDVRKTELRGRQIRIFHFYPKTLEKFLAFFCCWLLWFMVTNARENFLLPFFRLSTNEMFTPIRRKRRKSRWKRSRPNIFSFYVRVWQLSIRNLFRPDSNWRLELPCLGKICSTFIVHVRETRFDTKRAEEYSNRPTWFSLGSPNGKWDSSSVIITTKRLSGSGKTDQNVAFSILTMEKLVPKENGKNLCRNNNCSRVF